MLLLLIGEKKEITVSNHKHAGRMAGILSRCGLQESEQGRFMLTMLGQKYIHVTDVLIYTHRIARTHEVEICSCHITNSVKVPGDLLSRS